MQGGDRIDGLGCSRATLSDLLWALSNEEGHNRSVLEREAKDNAGDDLSKMMDAYIRMTWWTWVNVLNGVLIGLWAMWIMTIFEDTGLRGEYGAPRGGGTLEASSVHSDVTLICSALMDTEPSNEGGRNGEDDKMAEGDERNRIQDERENSEAGVPTSSAGESS